MIDTNQIDKTLKKKKIYISEFKILPEFNNGRKLNKYYEKVDEFIELLTNEGYEVVRSLTFSGYSKIKMDIKTSVGMVILADYNYIHSGSSWKMEEIENMVALTQGNETQKPLISLYMLDPKADINETIFGSAIKRAGDHCKVFDGKPSIVAPLIINELKKIKGD